MKIQWNQNGKTVYDNFFSLSPVTAQKFLSPPRRLLRPPGSSGVFRVVCSESLEMCSNRPFAAGGHMVQNQTYWRAKECARLHN